MAIVTARLRLADDVPNLSVYDRDDDLERTRSAIVCPYFGHGRSNNAAVARAYRRPNFFFRDLLGRWLTAFFLKFRDR